MFCFPFAGGSSWAFDTWINDLPPDVLRVTELWSVLLPGHEIGQPGALYTRLQPLIELLTPAFTEYPEKPFVFFGHSMGALIAFELAHELRRRGLATPVHLVVSGHRAPHLPDRHPPSPAE